MADYSEMPSLVEAAPESSQLRQQDNYSGTPYVFPAAPPSLSATSTPWSSPGQFPFSPFNHSAMMAAWPPHPGTPWAGHAGPSPRAYVMTPTAYPTAHNPAMPTTSDGWPQPAEDTDNDWVRVSRYFNGREDNMAGWPPTRTTSSRSLTPFSNSNSSSNTSSPSSMNSHISRSRSMRSAYDENTKRPPREWRADFNMARSMGLSSSLGSIFTKARSASISGSILDSPRAPKLHPYLRFSSATPTMFYDLRRNPSILRFRALERPVNPWDLTRFACEPPVPSIRLCSHHFPWYIDVESSNPAGVTLHDLFSAVYVCMMTPISQADWWNNEMDETTRERIARTWSERCVDDEERQLGVKRVDFLMERCVLQGFEKGKDGMWEMKVKRL